MTGLNAIARPRDLKRGDRHAAALVSIDAKRAIANASIRVVRAASDKLQQQHEHPPRGATARRAASRTRHRLTLHAAIQTKEANARRPDAGWSTVRRKRRGRNPPPPPPPKHDTCCDPMQTASAGSRRTGARPRTTRQSLRNNPWCVEALATLKRHAPGERAGRVLRPRFDASPGTRHQLAFLVFAEAYEAKSIQIHDLPLEGRADAGGLGRRAGPAAAERQAVSWCSLYFMPHCPASPAFCMDSKTRTSCRSWAAGPVLREAADRRRPPPGIPEAHRYCAR